MKAKNPRAFPLVVPSVDDSAEYGMSLRDYFAGQVIAGTCATDQPLEVDCCAAFAYEVADAMLAVRDK